jgi:hypothetical protein
MNALLISSYVLEPIRIAFAVPIESARTMQGLGTGMAYW